MTASSSALNIALAQRNFKVGDIPGNKSLILESIAAAKEAGAHLAVFSELSLLGYPPRDLVHRQDLLDRQFQALEEIAAHSTEEFAILLGYVDHARAGSDHVGQHLLNAAAFCRNGKVEARIAKTLLPTYDVFDEHRYFAPAGKPLIIEHGGHHLGISICEDAWANVESDEMPAYDVDPIAELVDAGAEVILNLSASPFSLDKGAFRRELLRKHCIHHGRPLIFVNQIGGNDELIFDGRSLAIDAAGDVRARLKSFDEDFQIVAVQNGVITPRGEEPLRPAPASHADQARRAVALGIGDYVRKSGFSGVLIGLSGGIDSAVVTVLAAEALGAENVHAVAMPSRFSSFHSREDARQLAENLGIEFDEISIEDPFAAALDTLEPHFHGRPFDVTEENIQARLRGIYLMALSNKFGKLVLACGNKSELAVGYSTLYGDLTGALAPIGDLPKMLVYDVARLYNQEAGREIVPQRIIEKPPSAELRPDQKDEDSLPPYEVLDAIVDLFVVQQQTPEEIIARGYNQETVRRIIALIHRAEYKRWQAPPIIKVTAKAFGVGWRYPLAKSY